MRSVRVTKMHPPTPPLSKDEGLRDIEHSMSIGNLILGVNSVTVAYLIRYDSLLQNATDIITKCNSYFITKCNRSLLQNASGLLLQNATFVTNCDSTNPVVIAIVVRHCQAFTYNYGWSMTISSPGTR